MSKIDFYCFDIRELDREFERAIPNEDKRLEYYQRRVRIACKNTICRFNVEKGCNKTIAYHPVFNEGICQSMQYDS